MVVHQALADCVGALDATIFNVLCKTYTNHLEPFMQRGPAYYHWSDIDAYLLNLGYDAASHTEALGRALQAILPKVSSKWDCPMLDDVCKQFGVDKHRQVRFVMHTRHPLPASLTDGLPSNITVIMMQARNGAAAAERFVTRQSW